MNPIERVEITCPDCGSRQYASRGIGSVLCRNCGRIIKLEGEENLMLIQFFPQNPPSAPIFISSEPHPDEHIICPKCNAEILRCKFCPNCGERLSGV